MCERLEIAELREVGQITFEIGGLIGIEPLPAVLGRILKKRWQAAPFESMLHRRLRRSCLGTDHAFLQGQEPAGEVSEVCHQVGDQGLSRRGAAEVRGELAHAERPQLVEENPSGQGLADLLQKQDAGRAEQDGERKVSFVVGPLDLVEETRRFLHLVEDRRPHRFSPSFRGYSSQTITLAGRVEVQIAELFSIESAGQSRLPYLAGSGEHDEPPRSGRCR